MGNRAVITTTPYRDTNIGIYVHWNGGQESIEGFLRAAKALQYRAPGEDETYGMARLVQAIGLFFGGDCSLGIGVNSALDTDNGDNGTWLIGPGWEIAGRLGSRAKIKPLSDEEEAKAEAIANTIVARTTAAAEVGEDA